MPRSTHSRAALGRAAPDTAPATGASVAQPSVETVGTGPLARPGDIVANVANVANVAKQSAPSPSFARPTPEPQWAQSATVGAGASGVGAGEAGPSGDGQPVALLPGDQLRSRNPLGWNRASIQAFSNYVKVRCNADRRPVWAQALADLSREFAEQAQGSGDLAEALTIEDEPVDWVMCYLAPAAKRQLEDNYLYLQERLHLVSSTRLAEQAVQMSNAFTDDTADPEEARMRLLGEVVLWYYVDGDAAAAVRQRVAAYFNWVLFDQIMTERLEQAHGAWDGYENALADLQIRLRQARAGLDEGSAEQLLFWFYTGGYLAEPLLGLVEHFEPLPPKDYVRPPEAGAVAFLEQMRQERGYDGVIAASAMALTSFEDWWADRQIADRMAFYGNVPAVPDEARCGASAPGDDADAGALQEHAPSTSLPPLQTLAELQAAGIQVGLDGGYLAWLQERRMRAPFFMEPFQLESAKKGTSRLIGINRIYPDDSYQTHPDFIDQSSIAGLQRWRNQVQARKRRGFSIAGHGDDPTLQRALFPPPPRLVAMGVRVEDYRLTIEKLRVVLPELPSEGYQARSIEMRELLWHVQAIETMAEKTMLLLHFHFQSYDVSKSEEGRKMHEQALLGIGAPGSASNEKQVAQAQFLVGDEELKFRRSGLLFTQRMLPEHQQNWWYPFLPNKRTQMGRPSKSTDPPKANITLNRIYDDAAGVHATTSFYRLLDGDVSGQHPNKIELRARCLALQTAGIALRRKLGFPIDAGQNSLADGMGTRYVSAVPPELEGELVPQRREIVERVEVASGTNPPQAGWRLGEPASEPADGSVRIHAELYAFVKASLRLYALLAPERTGTVMTADADGTTLRRVDAIYPQGAILMRLDELIKKREGGALGDHEPPLGTDPVPQLPLFWKDRKHVVGGLVRLRPAAVLADRRRMGAGPAGPGAGRRRHARVAQLPPPRRPGLARKAARRLLPTGQRPDTGRVQRGGRGVGRARRPIGEGARRRL